jgi:hypothetical protein
VPKSFSAVPRGGRPAAAIGVVDDAHLDDTLGAIGGERLSAAYLRDERPQLTGVGVLDPGGHAARHLQVDVHRFQPSLTRDSRLHATGPSFSRLSVQMVEGMLCQGFALMQLSNG